MIDGVDGKLVSFGDGWISILTRMGIAFRVMVHARMKEMLPEAGLSVTIVTALDVPQSGPVLYGFANEVERDLFLLLQKAPGVGPRLAHAAIGFLGVDELLAAIRAGNVKTLSRVPGLGAKKAERLARELAPWLEKIEYRGGDSDAVGVLRPDVVDALVKLGFAMTSASAVVEDIARKKPNIGDRDLLSEALKTLSPIQS